MAKCSKCGKDIIWYKQKPLFPIYAGKKLCEYCSNPSAKTFQEKCPRCGSKNIQAVAVGKMQGFDTGKGCCGAILLGPFGWLCGLSGSGKGKTEAKRMCMKCGETF
jgi:rRNA maturation protein Nop10